MVSHATANDNSTGSGVAGVGQLPGHQENFAH